MRKIIWRALILSIVIILGLNFFCYAEPSDIKVIKVEPLTIASFKVGLGPNELPNSDEGADWYNAPSKLFVDSKDNFYIFIIGINKIKKLAPNGKMITNFDLSVYGYPRSIYLDKKSDNIFMLTSREIIILDCEFRLQDRIDISSLSREKIDFGKIKVFNNLIFLYVGVDSDLFVVDYKLNTGKGKVEYFKSKYFIINNKFAVKAKQNLSFDNKENKIYVFVNELGKKEEIKLPHEISFASFMACSDSKLYLITLTPTQGSEKFLEKVIIVGKTYQISILDLKNSKWIFGTDLPLVDVDTKGNIYQLSNQGSRFCLYYYKVI